MGPLTGIRIVELAGLGPAPFCAMLLADLGADVIRVDRPPGAGIAAFDRITARNRRSLGIDLKKASGVDVLLRLVESTDVLIEGFRPGVAERLGFGPDICLERNPKLIYGRMTGWGQEGPLASRAGHDINYISLTGALHAIGPKGGRPVPPLNLVGDFGGGALYLAMGILAALLERSASDTGQVVDAAMTDGTNSLMTFFHEFQDRGMWGNARGANLLDGGAPFYTTYETADGEYVAVGALEPQFFAELLDGLGIDRSRQPDQYDPAAWPELRRQLAAAFRARSREEWSAVFTGSDACVTPVLSMEEAVQHPQMTERNAFVEVDGLDQPGVAPRFSRSQPAPPEGTPTVGEHTDEVLVELGFEHEEIAALRASGAVH
ncbi:MAG: CaiB/BaiF CoA-transferase family protein [Acidimicrobiia bacterium]|nr:CaiB/BaiF CoA-transferase family protein [Acidimicrobiia bacterium]